MAQGPKMEQKLLPFSLLHLKQICATLFIITVYRFDLIAQSLVAWEILD